jgi:hypothetical protein
MPAEKWKERPKCGLMPTSKGTGFRKVVQVETETLEDACETSHTLPMFSAACTEHLKNHVEIGYGQVERVSPRKHGVPPEWTGIPPQPPYPKNPQHLKSVVDGR